jgi:hypothetical protein
VWVSVKVSSGRFYFFNAKTGGVTLRLAELRGILLIFSIPTTSTTQFCILNQPPTYCEIDIHHVHAPQSKLLPDPSLIHPSNPSDPFNHQ